MKKLIPALMLIISTIANADTAKEGECAKASSEQNIYLCANEQLEEVNVRLNDVLTYLNNQIAIIYERDSAAAGSLAEHLKKSQKAWTVLISENCRMTSFFVDEQAPAYEFVWKNCLIRETTERINYLNRIKL